MAVMLLGPVFPQPSPLCAADATVQLWAKIPEAHPATQENQRKQGFYWEMKKHFLINNIKTTTHLFLISPLKFSHVQTKVFLNLL